MTFECFVRFFRGGLLFVSALTTVSCSPSMFFGGDGDGELERDRSYRKVNMACSNMDLSSSELDAPTFRKFLGCLNTHGGLNELAGLITQVSDDELNSVLKQLNQHLLKDRTRLFELEHAYRTLEQRSELEPVLKQVGKLFDNDELLLRSMLLFRESFLGSESSDGLHALARLSTRITPERVTSYLNAALTLAQASATGALQQKFRPSGSRPLREYTDELHSLLNAERRGRSRPLHSLLREFSTGRLFNVMDGWLGNSADSILNKTPGGSQALTYAFQDQGHVVGRLSSLYQVADQPARCLQGTRVIPNINHFLIDETARRSVPQAIDYLRRGNLLLLAVADPFCDFPDGIPSRYPVMMELAESSAAAPSVELVSAFKRAGLTRFLVTFTMNQGLHGFLRTLSELTQRGVWDDLLYLVSMPLDEDRDDLSAEIAFLLEPAQELSGKSIYDVAMDAVAQASPEALYGLVSSLEKIVQSNDPVISPGLSGLRSALLATNAHPLISLAQEVLKSAPQNETFFRSSFAVAERQPEEFKAAIRMLAEMARDGSLKDLLSSFVSLFHRYAEQGSRDGIQALEVPPFVARQKHNYSSTQAPGLRPTRVSVLESDPCRQIDLSVSLADYQNPKFTEHVGNVVACLNGDGKHERIEQAVRFLHTEKTASGRSFLGVVIEWLRGLGLNPERIKDLTERFNRVVDDGRLGRVLDALPLWITRVVTPADAPDAPAEAGTVAEAMIQALRPLAKQEASLKKVLHLAGNAVLRQEFPGALKYAVQVSAQSPVPENQWKAQGISRDRIRDWVKRVECENEACDLEARVDEIIDEHNHAISNHDLVNGKPRRAWTKQELLDGIAPILQKLADPAQSNPEKSIVTALMNVLGYFTADAPQEVRRRVAPLFKRDELAQWLRQRSKDLRLITYIYPGESKPRVRLVSTLDRFEMLFFNTDFILDVEGAELFGPLITNHALRSLMLIGYAWADEPASIWPKDIPVEHMIEVDGIKRPRTLREAYLEIDDLLKLFSLAAAAFPEDVQSKLHNIQQIAPVVRENLPGVGGPNAGGLKFVRGLAYELFTSSPASVLADPETASNEVQKNNLSFATALVRLGFLRQLSRHFSQFEEGDQGLKDFFHSLIRVSAAPSVEGLVRAALPSKDDQRLVAKAVGAAHDLQGIDAAYLRQFAFHGVAALNQIPLEENLMQAAEAAIRGHYEYLATSDLISSAFKSRSFPSLMRALQEDQNETGKKKLTELGRFLLADPMIGSELLHLWRSIDEDAEARTAAQLWMKRADALSKMPEFRKLALREIFIDLVDYFELSENEPSNAAGNLRQLVARILMTQPRSDAEEIFELIQRNPEGFYQFLTAIGYHSETQELHSFFSVMRRAFGYSP